MRRVFARMAPEARGTPFPGQIATLIGASAFALAAAFPFAAQAAELLPWAEAQIPDFTLTDIGGAPVALKAQNAETVLVHFFATWCEPCREELPALTRLAQRAGPSLKILTIAVAEPDTRVQRFAQTLPVTLPILLDADRAVAKSWKVTTLPTTFVLDAQLHPRLVVESDYAWDKVDPRTLIDTVSAGGGPIQTQQQQTLGEESNALR